MAFARAWPCTSCSNHQDVLQGQSGFEFSNPAAKPPHPNWVTQKCPRIFLKPLKKCLKTPTTNQSRDVARSTKKVCRSFYLLSLVMGFVNMCRRSVANKKITFGETRFFLSSLLFTVFHKCTAILCWCISKLPELFPPIFTLCFYPIILLFFIVF